MVSIFGVHDGECIIIRTSNSTGKLDYHKPQVCCHYFNYDNLNYYSYFNNSIMVRIGRKDNQIKCRIHNTILV